MMGVPSGALLAPSLIANLSPPTPVVPAAMSAPPLPATTGGGGGIGQFFKDFGQGAFGINEGAFPGMPNLPGKGDNLAMILGKILGGTKVSMNKGGNQFSFDGGGIRKSREKNALMQMLMGTRLRGFGGGGSGIVQSNPQPPDATTLIQ